jgi:predicted nucleic acid-binding protein
MSDKYRVVLDTNQIIGAGSAWLEHTRPMPDPNWHRRILIRVALTHTGLYCDKVIGEYLEKLVHHGHPWERCIKMMAYIMGSFTCVKLTTKEAPFRPSDLDDEVFLLCAIDGEADFLISEDSALTDLVERYSKPRIGKSGDLAVSLGA